MKAILRITAAQDLRDRTTVLREAVRKETDLRAAAPRDRTAVPRTSTEEEREMEDIRTDKTVSRSLQDLVWTVIRAVRVTVAVLAVLRVLDAALAVAARAAEAMEGREVTPEITEAAKALRQKLPQRIWRKSVRKKRDASVRRRISAPKKTISTRKTA